jgi:hypothetical protein
VLSNASWTFLALLVVSGFLTLVALSRTGIRHFWTQPHCHHALAAALEVLPVAGAARGLRRADRSGRARDAARQRHRRGPVRAHRLPQCRVGRQQVPNPAAKRSAAMMKRWMPSPPLSLALFVVWLLLNQSLEARHRCCSRRCWRSWCRC